MTEAQAKEAISSAWLAAWAVASPGAPVALGNELATPPAGAGLFSALSFGQLVEKQLTMGPVGSRRFETRGTVMVRLFGPLEQGEKQLADLALAVRAALASQTIAGHPLIGSAASSVSAKQGSWWTNTVTVPFRFYDTH